MADRRAVLVKLWDALNRRDLAAAGECLHPDVDWHDLIDNVRLHGREAVRDFWTRAFAIIKTNSTLLGVEEDSQGRIAVTVLHTVRSLEDRPWTEETVTHIYSFRDGLISRMDLE